LIWQPVTDRRCRCLRPRSAPRPTFAGVSEAFWRR